MTTETHSKISAQHLRRDAFLYVRQSTLRQVLENTESTQRQYALRDRAVALGWPVERIHTIDEDLGISGAHAENRDGFQRLVSEVALGHAGIVLGLEVSRLARNNADWQRLLELCALSGSLISDEDGIYDPAHFNDRLLLGLKGTMSEAELHILKARLQGGMRNKARRGELQMPLPIGLVYDAAGAVVLDPDRQIEHTVRLLFSTFREVSSASATVRRFAREGLKFPHRVQSGSAKGEVLWESLEHARVLQILHNPRYAGAFVFGRTRSQRTADLKSTSQVLVPREQWMVFIPNAHVGYITLEEFERNQSTLKQNLAALSTEGRGTVPREGIALLQGRVLCGRCGARMRIRYQRFRDRLIPYYVCADAAVRRAGRSCQSIRGCDIDEAVGKLLLKTLAPAALNVALAVQAEIAGRIEKADSLRQQQVERARYEAELKRRRFLKCDPDHRLVADALEADWNDQLRRLESLQKDHDRQRQADQSLLDEAACARILSLARDFPRVWNDARTESRERKRMLALLIEDVTLTKYDPIAVHVRFRGGQTASLTVQGPKPIALVRKFSPELIAELDRLLDTCTDQQIAERFNASGFRNWKGQPFTGHKVLALRSAYKLKSRFHRLQERGLLTAPRLARRFGVCTSMIHRWGEEGLLPREPCDGRGYLYEPVKPIRILRSGLGGKMTPVFTHVQSSQQETV
jgi:DNA invertase Pin-like site-specific DNA recombinase